MLTLILAFFYVWNVTIQTLFFSQYFLIFFFILVFSDKNIKKIKLDIKI